MENTDALSEGERDGLLAQEVPAALSVPIMQDRRSVAVMAALCAAPREWSGEDRERLTEAAARTADAVRRARSDAALWESEEKQRSLFQSLSQGYSECELIRDADGRAVDYILVRQNRAFERLLSMSIEDVKGCPVSEVVPGLESWWV